MRRLNRHRRKSLAQLLLAVALSSLAPQGLRASPGDVLTAPVDSPAPAEPPTASPPITPGDYSVSTQTGAATWRHVFAVPPGRGGMQPELSLDCSSQGALYGGTAAFCNLSLPSIEIDTSDGRLAGTYYRSGLAGGQRLVPVGEPGSLSSRPLDLSSGGEGTGPILARTFRAFQDSTYARYERLDSGGWLVRTLDGMLLYFGDTPDSTDGTRWMLSRQVDPFGNTVSYGYYQIRLGGKVVDLAPREILYTSNPRAGLDAHARVLFIYDEGPRCEPSEVPVGAALQYRAGKRRIDGYWRLRLISVGVREEPGLDFRTSRRTSLAYDDDAAECSGAHAPLRLLTGLRETAYAPDGAQARLPAVSLSYGPAERVLDRPLAFPDGGYEIDALAMGQRFGTPGAWPTVTQMLLDLDADGRSDLVRVDDPTACQLLWQRNTGTHFEVRPRSVALPTPWRTDGERGCSLSSQHAKLQNRTPPLCKRSIGSNLAYRYLDLDGDSAPEIVAAIHHDGFYDPNRDESLTPPGGWPPCPAVPASCPPGAACRHLEGIVTTPSGLKIPEPNACSQRSEHRRCEDDRHVWWIYWNDGTGTFSTSPDVVLSPVPLDSDTGDSSIGGGRSATVATADHALTDLDGDGLTDGVLKDYTRDDRFLLWRGASGEACSAATGGAPLRWCLLPDPESGLPYDWKTPKYALPHLGFQSGVTPTDRDQVSVTIAGIMDINADGLPDYVESRFPTSAPELTVFYNLGTRFQATSGTRLARGLGDDSFAAATSLYSAIDDIGVGGEGATGHRTYRYRPIDADQDGRVDIARLGAGAPDALFWNLGDAFVKGVLRPAWKPALERDVDVDVEWECGADLMDIDGDGRTETVGIGPGGLSAVGEANDPDSGAVRLLRTIENGYGRSITFSYASSADPAAVDSEDDRIPTRSFVVTSVKDDPGFGQPTSETRYLYRHPVYNQDRLGKYGFRGFLEVETLRPRGARTIETFDYDLDFSGRPVERVVEEAPVGPGQARFVASVSKTSWAEHALFGGAVLTYHPIETLSWTCRAGQSRDECITASEAVLRQSTLWSAIEASLPAGSTPIAYAATEEIAGEGVVGDQPGDRKTTTEFELRYRTRYWLRPRLTETWEAVGLDEGGSLEWDLTGRAETSFDLHGYGLPVASRLWLDETAEGEVVARSERDFDYATGNPLWERAPEQAARMPKGPVTSFGYDRHELYAATITNPLGHVVEETRDVATLALLSRRGPNRRSCGAGCVAAFEVRQAIDGLGRPLETRRTVDDAVTGYRLELVETNTYDDLAFESYTRATSHQNARLIDYGGSDWVTSKRTFDGAARELTSTLFTFDVVGDVERTTAYDSEGNVLRVIVPDPSSDASDVEYRFAYDSLGRLTLLRRPDGGGVRTSYDGLHHTASEVEVSEDDTSGELVAGVVQGSTTTLTEDVFGNLVSVVEEPLALAAEWSLEYDSQDRLTRVGDPDGVVTRFRYDLGGRRRQVQRGPRVWAYGYDQNGNLRSETTPCPGGLCSPALAPLYTATTAYDDLDRPLTRAPALRTLLPTDLQRLAIGATTFAYDDPSVPNSLGRLTDVTLPFGDIALAYTAEGLVSVESRHFRLEGLANDPVEDTREVVRSYNALGLETEVAHADGAPGSAARTVTRTIYDRRGLPWKSEWRQSDGSWLTLAEFSRGRAGVVRRRDTDFGQHREWSVDSLGRTLTDAVFDDSPSVERLRQQVTYTPSGNLDTLTTSEAGVFDFDYDERDQLEVATGPFGYTVGLSYLASGRLDTATVMGDGTLPRSVTYDYDSPVDPEAVSGLLETDGVPLAVYDYDSSGNVATRTTAAGSWTFLYDGDDAQREVTPPTGNTETYFYDETGARMLAVTPPSGDAPTRVRFWFGETELRYDVPSATVSRAWVHVGLGGQAVARIENGATLELSYHGTLGHLLLALTTTGEVAAQFTYGAFGEILASSGSTTTHVRRFNGKEFDGTSGLYFYGARYYDPYLLAWTQADPLYRFAPDLAYDQPRRLNLYAFSLNNPLRYVDPDGRNPKDWVVDAKTTVLNAIADRRRAAENLREHFHGTGEGTTKQRDALSAPPSLSEPYVDTITSPWVLGAVLLPSCPTCTAAMFFGASATDPAVRGALFTMGGGGGAGSLARGAAPVAEEAAVVSRGVAAGEAATAAQAAGRTSGAAAELTVGKHVFTDVSTGGAQRTLHPQVQAALDEVPAASRSPFHGACAEPGCLSKALSAGVDPAGGVSTAVRIRAAGKPAHGTPMTACSSCRKILDFFGVKY